MGEGAKPGANVLVADTPGIWLGPPKDGLQYYTNTPREHTKPWFVRASVKLFRERHYRGGGYIWREGGLMPLVNVGGGGLRFGGCDSSGQWLYIPKTRVYIYIFCVSLFSASFVASSSSTEYLSRRSILIKLENGGSPNVGLPPFQ